MRSLGDDYIKAEFRRHKDVTNPVHIIGFLSQWKVYLDELPRDADAKSFAGKRLDPTVFEKMSPEQLGQLYDLMHATKDVPTLRLQKVLIHIFLLDMPEASATVPSNNSPYSDLPSISTKFFEAKARKGLTFDDIAKALGKDEVWVAAAFYGQTRGLSIEQAKFSTEELNKLSEVLDIPNVDSLAALGEHWWPNRGLGPMPPTDPVIYRLYEGVLVYGHAIKAVIHEKFGDGIMSMIDCTVNIQRKPDPKGDRVVLTFEANMNSYLMTNTLDTLNDPLMAALSAMDPTTTLFDPFAPIAPWPWTLGPKLYPKWDMPQAQQITLTQVQLDAFKHELASPVPSPCTFMFEIEADTTKYESCYDEFMETKLAVIKELSEKAKAKPIVEEPSTIPDLSPAAVLPIASLEPLFECAYTLPDTFIDDLWDEMNRPFDTTPSSPCPSLSTSSSPSTSSSVSVSTPPSSMFTFSCPTPEPEASTSWFDLWDNEVDSGSVDDNPRDGDYLPFEFRDAYRDAPCKRPAKRFEQRRSIHVDYPTKPFPETPTKPKKRKALPSTRDNKRQKVDPEVVCRINGCRHISKTRFECFKHRETHFPGRFQCPHPSCRKVFVRSSSLSRHLKRPRNANCNSFAGSQSEWGTGLINFALHSPAHLNGLRLSQGSDNKMAAPDKARKRIRLQLLSLDQPTPAKMSDCLQNPLRNWHPLEPDARRSDFTISEGAQIEFREMRDVLQRQLSDLTDSHTPDYDGRIARKRHAIIDRLTEIEAVLSPQKKLPPEILSLIFSLLFPPIIVLPPRQYADTDPWWLATTCCVRWRQVIYGTQPLWNSVRLFYRGNGDKKPRNSYRVRVLKFIGDVLSRGTQILDIRLLNWRQAQQTPNPLADVLLPYAAQFTQLTIHSPIENAAPLAIIWRSAWPCLDGTTSFDFEFSVFCNAPNLQKLSFSSVLDQLFSGSLARISLPVAELRGLSIPFNRLTTLDILGKVQLAIAETHLLLSACINLETCALYVHQPGPLEPLVALAGQIILNSLQRFEIHVDRESVFPPLFSQLHLPSLITLELYPFGAVFGPSTNYDLGKIIVRWRCRIRHLIQRFTMSPSLVDNLLYTISPGVHLLDIARSQISATSMLKITSGALLPHVQEIHVCIRTGEDWDAFMGMIEGRRVNSADSLSTAVIYTVGVGSLYNHVTRETTLLETVYEQCQRLNNLTYGSGTKRISVRDAGHFDIFVFFFVINVHL
ncbi:hypothetical protein DXG01_015056 [Tephrocybe rancida]|nr:hypothetical protein DXG01_015056 [Tephrocybe rancida]